MGGKHKQAQRTKNNVRPSSSGRSAALLANTTPNFPGFDAVKECGYIPALSGFTATSHEDVDPNIDVNFQLVLKKMSKKDSTTRLKALQEFTQLVSAGDSAEAVKVLLPCWARLFCQLVQDPEHRVREAAHVAQRAIVRAARRNLAPHLRQLAGPWFTAQYDTHPPAASAAALALQDAFPPKKMIEAIIFCQQEILNYIIDNVTVQTPQTLSNPKISSAEDMESKYQRVLVSSLQGYALFLQKMPSEHLEAVNDLNKKLVSSKRFWKLASHKAPLVRNAWFSALIAVCQKAPNLLENNGSQVTLAVFGKLDETDPVVLPAVWEAALHVLTVVQNCWSLVDTEKLVFPKLWNVLREGGYGNAVTIFPNLLPFLSKLPASTYADNDGFCEQFFSSLRQGFKQKTVQQSISENHAVAKCYIECFRYLISTKNDDTEFCKLLHRSHLMSVIELALTERLVNCGNLFREVSNLVHHWSRNRQNVLYAELLSLFWCGLSEMCMKILKPPGKESMQPQESPAEWKVDRVVDLCALLKCPASEIPKSVSKVRFSSKEETDSELRENENRAVDNQVSLAVYSEDNADEFAKELSLLTCEVATVLINELKEHHISAYIKPLKNLANSALSSNDLLSAVGSGDLSEEKKMHELHKLLDETFCGWLQDKAKCSEDVVELIFSLLMHVSSEMKEQVIHHLYQISESHRSVLLWLLKMCVKHVGDKDVIYFIRGEKMSGELVSLSGEVSSCPDCDSEDAIEILRFCLKTPAIADTAVPGILRELAVGLRRTPQPTTTCTVLSCEAAAMSLNFGSAGIDLLAGIFALAVSHKAEEPEVVEAWHSVAPEVDVLIVPSLVAEIRALLHNCEVAEITEQLQPLSTEVKAELLMELKSARCDDGMWISWACHLAHRLLGEMTGDAVTPPPLPGPSRDTHTYAALTLLSVQLLLSQKSEKENQSSSDEHGDNDKLIEHMLELTHAVAITHDFLACYVNTPQANGMSACVTVLKSEYKKMIQQLSKKEVQKISDAIVYRCEAEGNTWVWAIYHLHKYAFGIEDGAAIFSCLIKESKLFGLPRMHTEQIFYVLNASKNCDVDFAETELSKTLPTITCWLNNVTRPFHKSGNIVVRHFMEHIPAYWKTIEGRIPAGELSNADWEEVHKLIEKLHFLAAVTKNAWHVLPVRMWDFILLTLVHLIKNLYGAVKTLLQETNAQPTHSTSRRNLTSFAVATCLLFRAVDNFFKEVARGDNKELDKKMFKDLLEEWNLVYVEEIYKSFTDLVKLLAGAATETVVTLDRQILLQEIGKSLMCVDVVQYLQESQQKAFIESCEKLIYSPLNVLQLIGFQVLKKLVPSFSAKDSSSGQVTGEEMPTPGLCLLTGLLDRGEAATGALLSELRMGESCTLEPFTESHAYCSAYLLLWSLTLELCAHASPQLRYQYAAKLSENGSLRCLLQNLFCLMPAEVLKVSDIKPKPPKAFMFNSEPSLQFSEPCDGQYLQHLACWVYFSTLRRLPAMVRQWWGEVEPRVANMVDKVTSCYVSPLLCIQEMQAVQQQDVKYNNMQVKVHSSVREVVVIYSLDEARVELVVKLAPNHPLGLVKVESGQRFVGSGQWRNWMLQLTIFLTHQNGSLWDGLMLLKSNLDKRFEGVEECYICFSVLHGSNFQLPKLCCKTCKKKFHSPCLYKWFSTSNKSTCPICRNIF